MADADRAYEDWKAPAEDGQVVIWPPPVELIAQTQSNFDRMRSLHSARLLNTPISELRRQAREYLGHSDDRPLIATGHQTELYHAGVWAKDALLHVVAEKIGARSVHIAVDTDGPKHLTLKWPGGTFPISDDEKLNGASWSGLLDAPTPAHLDEIEKSLRASTSDWIEPPALSHVIASLRGSAMECEKLSPAITKAMHNLDSELGLQNETMLASPIWMSPTFLAFAFHILCNPDPFVSAYNDALRNFRKRTRTKNVMRPMPDLFVGPDAVEVPFWLDDLANGTRSRPSIFQTDRGWVLELVSGEEFVLDPALDANEAASQLGQFLTSTAHRLSPRALTLTLYFRLLVADQFVHGIGGGRYDQVTDEIIANHFGVEPPQFAVTTATLYLPQAINRSRICLNCFLREGHQLKHAALGASKQKLLDEIDKLPRRSPQRSAAYFVMHKQLASAVAIDPKIADWRRRFSEAELQFREDQTLFDRELFYAIQPRSRLESIISRYRDEFSV